jgi:hypothetical protein
MAEPEHSRRQRHRVVEEREEIWRQGTRAAVRDGGAGEALDQRKFGGKEPERGPCGNSLLGQKGVELTERGGGDGISWDRRRPTARPLMGRSILDCEFVIAS